MLQGILNEAGEQGCSCRRGSVQWGERGTLLLSDCVRARRNVVGLCMAESSPLQSPWVLLWVWAWASNFSKTRSGQKKNPTCKTRLLLQPVPRQALTQKSLGLWRWQLLSLNQTWLTVYVRSVTKRDPGALSCVLLWWHLAFCCNGICIYSEDAGGPQGILGAVLINSKNDMKLLMMSRFALYFTW